MTLNDKIIKNFNDLNINTIENLNTFYAEDAVFTDPATRVQGLEKIKSYYRNVYANVKSISFKFDNIENVNKSYYCCWTMELQVTGLNLGRPYQVQGLSHITFNDQDLVTYHKDYLDLGAMVYEKIPILGSLISKIKNRLAH